jgi:broad specificity phosphatase PhoE
MRIYFVRHAESLKSAQDRHGGKGLPITEQGKFDIIELISFLEKEEYVKFEKSLFFCSDRVQVLETAKIIELQKQISFQIENALKNIHMGVLDGLSKEEAFASKYREEAENLEKWRKGMIKIDDFTITNAETMEQFYSRIFKFISSIVEQNKDVIIIGTRSVGVAIANVFNQFCDKIDLGNYNRHKFDPCSISKFVYEANIPKIEFVNNTNFLTVKPQYLDE